MQQDSSILNAVNFAVFSRKMRKGKIASLNNLPCPPILNQREVEVVEIRAYAVGAGEH